MSKYTVLTYIFGGYEKLRELGGQLDPDAQYICITDSPALKSDTWTVIYDRSMDNMVPFDKVCTVRYDKCRNYCNSDIIVRIDGSFTVSDTMKLRLLVDWFEREGYDLAILTHTYTNSVWEEVIKWSKSRNLSPTEAMNQFRFFESHGWKVDDKGQFQSGFVIERKTDRVKEFNRELYGILKDIGADGQLARLDQTIYTVLYDTEYTDLKMMLLSEEILHCNGITWCWHNTDEEIGYNTHAKATPYLHRKPTVLLTL